MGKFGTARGSCICLPGGYPGLLTRMWFLSKPKHGGFYHKGSAVRCILAHPSRTGQTCGGFLDFMHFLHCYQEQST